MTKKNKHYIYKGPVLKFGVCIEQEWIAETWAPTEKKAMNNLIYRYKKAHDYVKSAKIELTGSITKEV